MSEQTRRAWLVLRRWLCAWRGHPLHERRTFYTGTSGGPSARDEWRACDCGKVSSSVTRTRTRPPFGAAP